MPSASWSDADVDFLIDQAIAHRAEGGTRLNFKKHFWQSISDFPELAKPEKGSPKTRSACKEKWSCICPILFTLNASDPCPLDQENI